MPVATPAIAGLRGFDVDQRVDGATARAFAAHGYRFAVRYIPRAETHPDDLTSSEIAQLLAAGLAIMPVQHVASEESWSPIGEMGQSYGIAAASACRAVGVPEGVSVWLDLEGVAEGTDADDVIAYCRAWYAAVEADGFLPSLYVGWRAGLTPEQLYALPFTRYWSSYNLDADQYPATRGVCMRQHLATHMDFTAGLAIDVDTVQCDAEGGLPVVLAPDDRVW